LKGQKNSPVGDGIDATDQPGLKEMTLKAIDILQSRSNGQGWFMMSVLDSLTLMLSLADEVGLTIRSEAASIDKMMHVLDYERALGELLELDDTIRASIERMFFSRLIHEE
jgi:alkaline phosphatase